MRSLYLPLLLIIGSLYMIQMETISAKELNYKIASYESSLTLSKYEDVIKEKLRQKLKEQQEIQKDLK